MTGNQVKHTSVKDKLQHHLTYKLAFCKQTMVNII
uniref:Uncharacterized protein n=1 Tax=Rhizophora mucronata TaxID=61149 RepID=A0A2P2R3M5_RHIMU